MRNNIASVRADIEAMLPALSDVDQDRTVHLCGLLGLPTV